MKLSLRKHINDYQLTEVKIITLNNIAIRLIPSNKYTASVDMLK